MDALMGDGDDAFVAEEQLLDRCGTCRAPMVSVDMAAI